MNRRRFLFGAATVALLGSTSLTPPVDHEALIRAALRKKLKAAWAETTRKVSEDLFNNGIDPRQFGGLINLFAQAPLEPVDRTTFTEFGGKGPLDFRSLNEAVSTAKERWFERAVELALEARKA